MVKTRKSRMHSRGTMKYHQGTCCEATFHGLHKWYQNKFEKLGWMILAKEHGYNDKIAEYKSSIHRLKQAIEHKMTHVKDSDRKHDLMIMHHNVMILIDHVNRDFQKGGGMYGNASISTLNPHPLQPANVTDNR